MSQRDEGCWTKLVLSAGMLVAHVLRLQTQQCVINTNAITNGSCCTQSLSSATLQYMRGCFLLTLWILLRTIVLVRCTVQKMKPELDPGPVWPLAPASSVGAEGGLDLLTRMAACSPEQLLSPFPFTSGYDVPAAWLVFRRGLCSGNPGWQAFSFVSDRRAAAVVWPCWQFYWLLYHFHPCSPCPKPWRGGLPSSF